MLVVANDLPFPPDNGASLDTWGRIKTLRKLGFVVDIIATLREEPAQENISALKKEADQVFIVQRERNWKTILHPRPFQIRSRMALQNVQLRHEYDAVVLEAEHVASILDNPTLRAKRRILRIHNNEVRFFQEMRKSTRNLKQKLFYQSEALKYRGGSFRVKSACDALWFISKLEKEDHVRAHPEDSGKSFFVPPAVEISALRRQHLKGRQALFIGTLSLAINVSAIQWYISAVHPFLRDIPDYVFAVAGNTRGTSIQNLSALIESHSNARLIKDPADLESLYSEAAVFVNPVSRGAGLKLKTIDAIQAGLPVVTTSNGIEGSGLLAGKHVLVADSAESFAARVRQILGNKELGHLLVSSAQQFLAREYDQEQIIERSLSSIFAGLENRSNGRILNPAS